MKKNFFNSRALKHGALATALTIGFVVVVVVINAIAGILLERYPLAIDLTSDNRFTLTEESIEYVSALEQPVSITVCMAENAFENYTNGDAAGSVYSTMFKQAYEIMKDYTHNSDKITLSFIDLNQNPTFADKYPQAGLTTASIVVESPLRYKVLQVSNLFSATQYADEYVAYKSKAEQTLTSAILYVTDDNPVTVIALNETRKTLPGYVSLLENNAYNVVDRSSLSDELDKDADVLLIAGQIVDFSEEELDKIDKWLDNDGLFQKTLMYVPAATLPEMPNMEEFLNEWGFKIHNGYLAETNPKNIISSNAFMNISSLSDTAYAQDINTSSQILVTPYAHAVEVLWETSGNRFAKVIASTADTAVLIPASEQGNQNIDMSAYEQQSYNVAAWGYRSKYIDSELVSSNLVVFGSETALNDSLLTHASLNNGAVGLSLVSTSVGTENEVTIIPIDFDSDTITVTGSQVNAVMIVFVIGLPVVVLFLAVFTFFRRRHL